MLSKAIIAKTQMKSVRDCLEEVGNNRYGIDACAQALGEMLTARACTECPDWCKNDFIAGGLITAISALCEKTDHDTKNLSSHLERSLNAKDAA